MTYIKYDLYKIWPFPYAKMSASLSEEASFPGSKSKQEFSISQQITCARRIPYTIEGGLSVIASNFWSGGDHLLQRTKYVRDMHL